jgi:hypothetical protein
MDEAQALYVALEICGILSFLHSQPAPIIHRDIKPSNIIFNPVDNTVKLIDFGISRKYSKNADSDTVNFGTKKFAPPEQYGYSQTDCRADIFALGVVLRYMLSGSADGQVDNKGLNKIIEKCAAFSPKDRYKSADALKRALVRYKYRKRQRIVFTIISIIALSLLFFLGYDAVISFMTQGEKPYVFIDPFMEKAARAALGKVDGEAIYIDELSNITRLYMVCDEVATSWNEYVMLTGELIAGNSGRIGGLNDLGDLRNMPNLMEVAFAGQTLSDITALADCLKITNVQLKACPVSDISPLAALPLLRSLGLMDVPVTDYSPLGSMKGLNDLHFAQQPIQSIAELGNVYHLDFLTIGHTRINSLEGIENFTALTTLHINGIGATDFSALDKLPRLQELRITRGMERDVRATMTRDDVRIIYND